MQSLKSPKRSSSQNANESLTSTMIPRYNIDYHINSTFNHNNNNNNTTSSSLTTNSSTYNRITPSTTANTTTNNTSSTNSSSKNSSTNLNTTKWIEQFCSTDKFLCKVDTDFITDAFNLIGLEEKIPYYRQALSIILDDSSDRSHPGSSEILSSAENLYGLIHARYILTDSGLKKMLEKYKKRRFGLCNRYYCDRASMLPIGLSDEPNMYSVRLYCPRCMDLYAPQFSPKSVLSDGAWFGTSFPHMFFMVYPEYRPLPSTQKFTATLYGFKIHENAYEYQREQFEAAERARKPVFLKTTISSSSSTAATTTTTTNATAAIQSSSTATFKMNGDHHNHQHHSISTIAD
uniref:Casein kinase II subunit beta n=1 Tax=Dermatophagoides pteronyssinus TaxID=6956 RepID=A0A6P6YK69_DERPT|nr:casein kinase II subunit beta-like isoform X2 [Dermatophagoides pteronyssinus]